MEQNSGLFKRGYLNTYIIGSVPSYETLDIVCLNKKEVFIFIDFNNMIKGLYYPRMIELILQQIEANDGVFPSILIDEWIKLQNYLEIYAELRNIPNMHTIYFSEGGQSYYHKNIHKDYKKRRKNALFQLPPTIINRYDSYDSINELFRQFLVSSWKWIEVLSKQANILSIRLENLDADFIPELLLRQFNIYNDDAVYIIFSTDGDHIQTLDIGSNVYIFDGNILINDSNWLQSKRYLNPSDSKDIDNNDEESNAPIILEENKYTDITPDKIILFKATVGDSSDCIPGIKGVGVKTFFKKFIEIIPNDIRSDDIEKVEKICYDRRSDNKVCAKIVNDIDTFKKMIKLVSFKHLIQWLLLNHPRYSAIKKMIVDNIGALQNRCNLKALYKNSISERRI